MTTSFILDLALAKTNKKHDYIQQITRKYILKQFSFANYYVIKVLRREWNPRSLSSYVRFHILYIASSSVITFTSIVLLLKAFWWPSTLFAIYILLYLLALSDTGLSSIWFSSQIFLDRFIQFKRSYFSFSVRVSFQYLSSAQFFEIVQYTAIKMCNRPSLQFQLEMNTSKFKNRI